MGDFSANFHRPESGIHTMEGNLSGPRAAALTKKRAAEQQSFEERKLQLQKDGERSRQRMNDKFDSDTCLTAAERTFRDRTVGLVTAEEFKRAALEADAAPLHTQPPPQLHTTNSDNDNDNRRTQKQRKKALHKNRKVLNTLSFADAEDAVGIVDNHESEGIEVKKNPEVDTSFLPDRQREQQLLAERARLRTAWLSKQEQTKSEMLEITYSYWDGSGHRRSVRCTKGDTIATFLESVRKDLAKQFREMQTVSTDALLYVKEDLIIPQDITFYDLIVTKARGKSGPLFNFDVHDDIRIGAVDSRVEKDESHPGKVVERRWYDRNKHIFPASRWEVFDASKDYGGYTIHGGELHK